MNYIVFDLELNSKPFKNRHPNEIIEIGAVKLDDELQVYSTFQAFVKPKVYKKLFSIVKNKTEIKQEDINNADEFRKVISQFRGWLDNDYVLCSWGHDDIHHLKSNCKLHHMNSKWMKNTIDIQKHFSKAGELPLGQVYSLKNALELLDISVTEKLHRAEVDARYTAEIFRRIFDSLELEKVNCAVTT